MHFTYTTLVVYLIASLCSAGPIDHSRLILKKGHHEPEFKSSFVIDTSTVVSYHPQDTSATSSGSSFFSTMASTFSTVVQSLQTESSSSAVLHHTTADDEEDDSHESHSAFGPTTTLTSSHMAARSSSAPATHTTNTLTHGYSAPRASTSKIPDTRHSTSLLADTYSQVAVVRASSAAVVSSEIAEPTVTTTTVTSTIFTPPSSTAIPSGAPSSHSSGLFGVSSSTWKTTISTSHLLPVSATSISPSTGFSWRATPTSTLDQSSTIKRTSSHLFHGSTATTDSRFTVSSSPTVGVIRTLPGAGSSGASTGAHQSPTATASQSDHTSVHSTSGTVSNNHTPNTWTVQPTAAAPHTDSISHSQTATSTSITQSSSTGLPTTKSPAAPDVTGTVFSGTGIVIIIPGVSTSRNITIPLSPDDNIPSTATVSISTNLPHVTTSVTQNTTPANSPHATGLVTTIHPTSTETKVVPVMPTTTEQTQRPTPTTSVSVLSEASSKPAAQATGSKKAPAPTSDIPDNGSSLVVNPISPVFLTVTETKTVTEKTTETKTVMMTVTATVD